jgi:hypothetical protein
MTDRKAGAAFATDHPLHSAGPAMSLSPAGNAALAAAGVLLSLDWIDLADTLRPWRQTACVEDHPGLGRPVCP